MSDDASKRDGETSDEPVASEDVVLVQGPTEHGVAVVRVRREPDREASVEVGEMRALVEGQPIVGEVVTLTPRTEHPRLFDAKVVAKAPGGRAPQRDAAELDGTSRAGDEAARSALGHKGPPRVATDAYRDNWDGIFAMRSPKGAPN